MNNEYQILGCKDALKLTAMLNKMSGQGWRPIGFAMRNLSTAMQSYEVLMERNRDGKWEERS